MKIEAKTEGTTSKGNPMVTFTIDGKKYNSFNPIWNKDFNVGDYVHLTLEQSGKFMNLKGMTRITAQEHEKIVPVTSNSLIEGFAKEIAGSLIHKFANTYEFGRAGNRFKIYFWTLEDLKLQLKEITDMGLYDAVENITIKPEQLGKD